MNLSFCLQVKYSSPTQANNSILLITIMRTKIGSLSMVDLYKLLKLVEIINSHFAVSTSTQSTTLGSAGMSMSPKMYALSKTNPWQDPSNPGAVPPWYQESHGNLCWTWTSSRPSELKKNQHDFFINIGHALCSAPSNAIPYQFKPVQQIDSHGFETTQLMKL